MLKAGFVETDITPPVGTHIIGWLGDIVSTEILDPIHARAAVFESAETTVGFVQTDTLCVRWTTANEIRRCIQAATGVPGTHILVAATHTHGGPAVANLGDAPRDDRYVETLVTRCVAAFQEAVRNRRPCRLGFQHGFEFDVASNRRVVQRDGTVRTHGAAADPKALRIEGPMDPEVAVLATRAEDGTLLGCLVNYACHPVHHGMDGRMTAGYPGILAQEMKRHGCPVTLFLNGACGNTHTASPVRGDYGMKEAGRRLADDAAKIIEAMTFSTDWPLVAASRTLSLPVRTPGREETEGTNRGANRFVDSDIYDRHMPALLARLKRGPQPAEVQMLRLGNVAFTGIPAEYFVEHGLRIKQETHPVHTLIVSHANGMIGYVPTRDAFTRGGYETTLAPWSRMAPEAGDLLADAAIGLVRASGTDERKV